MLRGKIGAFLSPVLSFLRDIKISDERRLRYLYRRAYYLVENHEFYRLQKIRESMMKHKVVDKEEMIKQQQTKNEKFVWVFHLRPTKTKTYGFFWKPKSANKSN
eukprot:TRINITY_DN1705_c0_g1_i1.p1 TRINITY_DN1705_c0_g1~~TRINITY_DN1705_c0_g1_i1.p1  ORF type:complete len:104 (+),score=15.02 TRINITY_DN1705_c0_g1_i1:155-466(+)